MQLIIQDLTKNFGDKKVLKRINFTFEEGKIYALLGRNGAGKTTFFKVLMKQLKTEGGSFFLHHLGSNIDYHTDDFGLVLDQPNLPEFLTGYEFIKFFIEVNQGKIRDEVSVETYFELIDFQKEDYHRLISEYSHGMKNKIQILLSLIVQPKVILLDEPLTSFDVVVAMEIKDMIRRLKKNHIIILSTHILELAKELSDEIVILNDGVFKSFDKKLTEAEIKRVFLSEE